MLSGTRMKLYDNQSDSIWWNLFHARSLMRINSSEICLKSNI